MSDFRNDLTQDYLRKILHYSRTTGLFRWKIPKPGRDLSKPVGTPSRDYLVIRIDGNLYFAHRLAWVYVKGCWPEHYLDHRDGSGWNNIFKNLREATPLGNSQNNHHKRTDNTTGFMGVSKRRGGFRASIQVNHKAVHLGDYSTPESASVAYLEAKRKLHPTCTI